jgi:hypothetical protein
MRGRIGLTNLVAIGFALGSLEHAIGFVLLLFGVEMYAGYPAWRHAAFTVVDALIAFLAITRPHRLLIPLLAFLIEQILINGAYAWRTWRTTGEILWVVPVMIALIAAARVIAARERTRMRVATAQQQPSAPR